jgi:coenzyme PQQ precursor peptide PqqA
MMTFKQLLHKILWRVPMTKDEKKTTIAWTTPTLVEICIGLEINGYLPAEF